jgi:hydantoinase/carbamoylase family amidase
MMGSHLDSQPYGGRFDGVIGVLGALEVVETMHEQGIVPEMPIEVVAFSDEEGCRFNKGIFGSRGMIGALEPGELERADKDGITRRQALLEWGCDPERFDESVYPPGRIRCFLEMHIEQGPVLDKMGVPVGIVSGIAGPLWLTVTMKGFAGHAGSVPMPLRQDAFLGAAEVALALNRIVKQEQESPTVGTVGNIEVFPNSRNIIPERVRFTVDLRDIDNERRDRYEMQLVEAIRHAAERYRLDYEIREDARSAPRYCADWIKHILAEECKALDLSAPELMSGPFHDALTMSNVCDFGMIFVRCKDGISHNPAEYAADEDIALGTQLLYRTACRIAVASTK